jgi:hypothetical protein
MKWDGRKVRRFQFHNQIQHRSGCGGLRWSGHTAQKNTARADVPEPEMVSKRVRVGSPM